MSSTRSTEQKEFIVFVGAAENVDYPEGTNVEDLSASETGQYVIPEEELKQKISALFKSEYLGKNFVVGFSRSEP